MINKIFSLIVLAAFSLFIFSGCDQVTQPDTIPDNIDNENYELVWFDEFNQTDASLDAGKWGYDTGYGGDGWGNDEWQLYTSEPENVRVEDGNLVITAVWDSVNYSEAGKRDGSITSARVNTKDKFSFKFGKVKARIKPPSGMGMWPAFWMLGNSYDTIGWPQCGEIDIMEMSPIYHNDNTTMFTLHWWNEAGEYHDSDGAARELSYSLTDDYHIYELEWDEQRVIGKIDDITYFVRAIDPAGMDEFLRKFFLIFNVAVGGNLGGSPDETTQWNQSMYVDWVHVYQPVIETYGLFTDETPVDAGLQVGMNAEIYVWENTLSGGSIDPYEGSNVISWTTNGVGWFGGGISSSYPVDLSKFAYGNIKFMIKIPADVTFKIGINDTDGNENYVIFPANETVFGLVRDGEWGQATIPVDEIKGSVDLEILDYEFIILEQNGAQCEFALDDIYWAGGGSVPSSVAFDADSYAIEATGAVITVDDLAAAGNTVSVSVDNETESISIEFVLDAMGMGTGTVNFGPTDDATDTIAITAGGSIIANYLDFNGNVKTATAEIESSAEPTGNYGIFTDETPVDDGLEVGVDAEIFVWENTLTAGTILPYEGENVISWLTTGIGWFGGGISSNIPGDLSEFADGNIKFMIKIPANVTFKIGIKDTAGNENYVSFPANQTAFGLVRDGDWGQASIPVDEIKGNVNLAILEYEFMILEQDGTQCEFALDDIYWNGEGAAASSVSFDAGSYANDATGAVISVDDGSAAGNTVNVTVDNGTETISVDIILDAMGIGTGSLNFGPTDDATDTIAITAGGTLTAIYTDGNGIIKSDTADIESGSPDSPEVAAPSPSQSEVNVISLFSDAYTDVPVDTWSADWDQADVSDLQVAGDDVKLYTNLVFAGIEFTSQTIDGSEMTYFHMDIWTPDPTAAPAVFKIKLVDFGADGAWSGGDDVEHELTFDANTTPALQTGSWVSFDIPMTDFTNLVTTAHLAQLVISGDLSTVYVDNIFFYKN
ncbi:MAG: glycoside hydrolase family 16 protein [Candidatus Cloacimonetes bacterium]|nr:glycoside hydrolase family 16 protein [Candidatus Cloacimonadota bacterium]